MSKYKISKEFKKYCFKIPFCKSVLRLSRAPLKLAQVLCRDASVKKTHIKVSSCQMDIFASKNAEKSNFGVFYVHGGGFGYEAAPCQIKMAFDFVKEGYTVCFPHYRLLPRYKYPIQRNDVLACYECFCANFLPQGAKIAIVGDSAGGCLATQLLKDIEEKSLTLPCAQMLLYPVLDSTCQTESMKKYTDTPLWNAKNNVVMWRMLLKNCDVNASPLQTPLPKRIPATYLEVAEFDCLLDEGLQYAERLKRADAEVETFLVKGAMHGYDFARSTKTVAQLRKKRFAFLTRCLK